MAELLINADDFIIFSCASCKCMLFDDQVLLSIEIANEEMSDIYFNFSRCDIEFTEGCRVCFDIQRQVLTEE